MSGALATTSIRQSGGGVGNAASSGKPNGIRKHLTQRRRDAKTQSKSILFDFFFASLRVCVFALNSARNIHQITVGKNRGGLRAWVSCSKAYASLSRVGSLQARPKNEMPIGRPKASPAGTVIFG